MHNYIIKTSITPIANLRLKKNVLPTELQYAISRSSWLVELNWAFFPSSLSWKIFKIQLHIRKIFRPKPTNYSSLSIQRNWKFSLIEIQLGLGKRLSLSVMK